MASDKRSEGFEELYDRLEATVGRLENGGLTLEESLALFEEGMELARRCREILRQAELRVTRLREAFSEQTEAPGEGDDGNAVDEDGEEAERR